MNLFYRYDYFLIWGHGLRYADRIINQISNERIFEIVNIVKHQPENGMEEFVFQIYNFDYAPYEHLINKTNYLMKTPSEVLIIFVRNYQPEEVWIGENKFRHLESESIRNMKERIRDQYNEYYKGRRTENHVIHASDNEEQTDYLLKLIGFKNGIEIFERRKLLEQPYHLMPATRYIVKEIELEDIYASVLCDEGQLIKKLLDTPHYKAAIGNGEEYREYINKHRGKRLRDFYSLEKYKKLIVSFEYEVYLRECKYIIVRMVENKYVICDGFHRAAILLARGYSKVIVLEVIYEK